MKFFARLPLLLLALVLAGPVIADPYTDSIEAWRRTRISRLKHPTGWLTLIGRHPLELGTWSVGSAGGNAIRLAAGPDQLGTITYAPDGKVTFSIHEDASAIIDNTNERTAELDYRSDNPTYVRTGNLNMYVMERSGKLFLRVRDIQAERRIHFAGIESYPIDPAWRIEATWVPFEPAREIKLTNIIGLVEPATIPGKAVFTHASETYSLLAIDEGPESRLFFVLTDTTAGTETYEACRFLYADRPKDGKIILDFNQVYNPPCAFTPFATCPLPPKENFLPFALRVGEKKYQDAHP
jgi:uncharacterized protein (DUF1684 family)